MTNAKETIELARVLHEVATHLFETAMNEAVNAGADDQQRVEHNINAARKKLSRIQRKQSQTAEFVAANLKPPRLLTWRFVDRAEALGQPVTWLSVELNLVARCAWTSDEKLVSDILESLGESRYSSDSNLAYFNALKPPDLPQ